MIRPGDKALDELAGIRIDARVPVQRRSRLAAGLLGVLLGALGAHRFYLGYRRIGWTQLALTIATAGIAGVWGVAEGWLILAGAFGRDARGCGLTHHSAVHLLIATSGSIALHVGTTLGAVWFVQHSAALLPPPSGVDSIALSPAQPPQSAAAQPITFTPPIEREAIPEIDTAAGSAAPPLEAIAAAQIDAPLTAPMLVPPVAERPRSMQPVSLDKQFEEGGSPAQRVSTSNRPLDATPKISESATSHRPLPPIARAAADVAPTTSVPSPASMASRESRGFDTDSLPQKLDFPQPVYPPELRRRGITGLVKLRVRVGADGRVKRASVFRTSGYQAFDRAALEAIGRWRFEPARRGGVAVEMEIAVPIRFVIEAAAD